MERIIKFDGPWDKFLGYENDKCIEVIAAMGERILCGDRFSAVDVVLQDGSYHIVQEGHHTSLAHYLMNVPLKCWVSTEDEIKVLRPECFFPISHVNLVDAKIEKGSMDVNRIYNALKHFPKEDAQRFCLDNGLDESWVLPYWLKSQ